MRKLEETLSMTSRWATDSRHITQREGMYWSYSLMQDTCAVMSMMTMVTNDHDVHDNHGMKYS